MFDKKLADKIDTFIKKKFPVIYDYKFDGIVFLRGGTIRNLIMDIPVKDLDLVILTQGKCQIKDFIRKFKLKCRRNAGGGYKIIYNNFLVDMYSYSDLLDVACYDIDFVFYDIEKHMFISCGAFRALEKRTITEVNSEKVSLRSNILRLKKITKFVKYVTHNNKKVKVRQNSILFRLKLYVRDIKIIINKIINNNFKKCFRFLKGCRKQFSLIVLCEMLMTLISIFIPFLSGKLLIEIMLENYKDIFILSLLIPSLKILLIFVSSFISKYNLSVSKKMKYNICSDISKGVLNCELDYSRIGTFMKKLKNDPNEITKSFIEIKRMLIECIGNFCILIYIFYLDYRVGIIFLISVLIIFKIKSSNIQKMQKKRGFVKKHISDIDNCASTYGEMFYCEENNMIDDTQLVLEGDTKLEQIIQNVFFIILFIFSLLLVKNNSLKVSSFIIILMYIFKVFTLGKEFEKLEYAFLALSRSCFRIFSLLSGPFYVKEVFGNKYSKKCSGNIEFSGVKFRYNTSGKYILDDCSFKIKSNETVALVGKSGAGKTTILNLIARLYNVDDGLVKTDNVDVNEYSESFIRENTAIVSQSPYLFDMSIKDNLRLVEGDITEEEIIDVCKLVYLDEFINSLPKKYDTIIGDNEIKLSSSQKMRLGIARALIKNTKIILLDNVTGSLDSDEGIIIGKVIKNIQKNHTIIVITDEVSILKDCSRILVLDNGKIVGDETHKKLIKNNDVYNNLYKVK